MPIIADYRIIQDVSFSVDINREESFEFGLPGGVRVEGNNQRPVMAFVYDPSSNADNLRLEVSVNGELIESISNINSGIVRSHWEVFGGDILNTTDDNRVTFHVEGNEGNIRVSDVILWFQRDI